MYNERQSWLVLCFMVSCICIPATADPAQRKSPGGDFEQQVVQEAVDLSAVNSEGPITTDMESLLHWAIGKWPRGVLHKGLCPQCFT